MNTSCMRPRIGSLQRIFPEFSASRIEASQFVRHLQGDPNCAIGGNCRVVRPCMWCVGTSYSLIDTLREPTTPNAVTETRIRGTNRLRGNVAYLLCRQIPS
jgi:hypothetical protein